MGKCHSKENAQLRGESYGSPSLTTEGLGRGSSELLKLDFDLGV